MSTKARKLSVNFAGIQDAKTLNPIRHFERASRNEKRSPGRPTGKRSNPAFRQYTILIRIDSHDRALSKLRKITAKPDFGEYVETLILEDLKGDK